MNKNLARIIAALISFAAVVAGDAQTITLGWTPSSTPGINSYIVFSGTQSRNYTTNWPATGTNATLNLGDLKPGTNYLAVAALQIQNGTNAVLSDYSGEVRIIRAAPPVLRLSVEFQTSTNLTAWIDSADRASAIVSADRALQFWRPSGQSIEIAAASPPSAGPENGINSAAQPPAMPPK